MMSRFSPSTEAILRRNGWYPGRHMEKSWFDATVELLRERYEFELFPAAASILDEFGGLKIIRHPVPPDSSIEPRIEFDFEPLYRQVDVTERFAPYCYLYEFVWGQKLGRRIYPIGNIDPESLVLMMVVDDEGHIYAVSRPSYHVAANIDGAIESLLNQGSAHRTPARRMLEMEDETVEQMRQRVLEERRRRDAKRAAETTLRTLSVSDGLSY